jgi:twitching motility protein PilT
MTEQNFLLNEFISAGIERHASDLHITVNYPPALRIDGQLVQLNHDPLSVEQVNNIVRSLVSEEGLGQLEKGQEIDVAFSAAGGWRIRCNIFLQRGSPSVAVRLIPSKFMSFEELGLPTVIYNVVKLSQGLVLVTGPTGSGKTTTLASVINYINQNRSSHIITIEDPIEYIHKHGKSIIHQREVGSDTHSFADALKYVLREDPNVILIGEMRDLETIAAALTVAETGHLVFATLHTPNASQSVDRIIDVFPPYQQMQIRAQLSFVLQAVFTQKLLPQTGGKGRLLACEVLIATSGIRALIRDQKEEQIPLSIQTGAKYGMQTMNASLVDLYRRGKIDYQQALTASSDIEDIKRLLANKGPS